MLEIRNHNLEIRKALHIFCLAQPLYPLRVPRPRTAKALQPTTAVILMTAFGSIQTAVEAMRVGAFDFLEKPFNPDRMSELAKKATNARRLVMDNRALRRELSDGSQLMKKLIGGSPVMERLREDILDLGQADGHVLIDGETGTGKTLVAHALHAVGSRAGKKFVLVSCGALEEDALSKRLFGPMMPEDAQLPAIEEARGGTLVLEGVESLSETLQARLLSAINDQGTPAETRIVAISNLQEAGRTSEDALRSDLFYRLAALRITVPPLRQRGEDILTLFTRLSEEFADEYGCETPQVSAQEAAQLLQAPWPGNVRQLRNTMESMVVLDTDGTLDTDDLPPDLANAEPTDLTPATGPVELIGQPLSAIEKWAYEQTLKLAGGNREEVARILGVGARTVYRNLKKYDL